MALITANTYKITIGKTGFKALNTFLSKNSYTAYYILCDDHTLQHCLPLLVTNCPALAAAEVIELEHGEQAKSLEFSAHIWQTLLENKAGKNTLLINLGGGVVSDLGGFTASVYKRGIDFINVPTSLLAMADASVGGKTGIDFGGIKNSIGSFAQPKAVFVVPEFLQTLPARHYQNGLAEVYKIALIADAAFWKALQAGRLKEEQIISQSIALKNKIVLKDPFDKGLRNSLNFGHTIGHAIEGLLLDTPNGLLHGEAIVVGMLVESHIAYQKKLISKTIFNDIDSTLNTVFEIIIPQLPLEPLMSLMGNDKKIKSGGLQMALPNKLGGCKINVAVTPAQVQKALAHYNLLA